MVAVLLIFTEKLRCPNNSAGARNEKGALTLTVVQFCVRVLRVIGLVNVPQGTSLVTWAVSWV
jgi:hypothetical protein